jgi:3-methyl-2-oxobutanoate hydroxymethyltransferase
LPLLRRTDKVSTAPSSKPAAQNEPIMSNISPEIRKPITLHRIREIAARGEKLSMLTCYDATFARVFDAAGVELFLVGDSLGMTVQGHETTVPVTLESMAYHVRCVAAGNSFAWVVGDLPYGTYHESPAHSYASARLLMQAGAHMVKLEGGGWTAPTVQFLCERGVPVCAHLGLTPQTVHALGGYRIQGRSDAAAEKLIADALALEAAGAAMLVVELVPTHVGKALADALTIPVIGIGAGKEVDGQVLVMHDMLGLTMGKLPRFVKNFAADSANTLDAVRAYVAAVKSGAFPEAENAYEQ